jgi:hypothetical protein
VSPLVCKMNGEQRSWRLRRCTDCVASSRLEVTLIKIAWSVTIFVVGIVLTGYSTVGGQQ